MQLPNELMNKFRQLLDKPISILTVKQLKSIIVHPSLQIHKIIQALLIKYRADLIIHLIVQNVITFKMHQNILKNILSNVMQYNMEDLLKIWRLILLKQQEKGKRQLGYEQILKEAMKVTDTQRKDKLFHLICQNIGVVWGQGNKAIFSHIINSYFKIFTKMLIYVPYYVVVVKYLLVIHSKNQQQLPSLQQDSIISIIDQIVTILTNTLNKPLHTLQKECLKTLICIGQNYQKYVYNTLDYVIRCINNYLFKKAVRDDARKAMQLWKDVIQVSYLKINLQKMEKVSEIKSQQSEILIDNVIERTNNYRKKFQVEYLPNHSVYEFKKDYLKKGIGIGGGKTYLDGSPDKDQFYRKSKIQFIVDQCLKGSNKKNILNKAQIGVNTSNNNKYYLQKPKKLIEIQEKLRKSDVEVQTFTQQFQEQPSKQINQQVFSEDLQIQQINNLIQLAYSYKFCQQSHPN